MFLLPEMNLRGRARGSAKSVPSGGWVKLPWLVCHGNVDAMHCEGVGSNNVITCRDLNNMLNFQGFDMLQVSKEGGLRIHPIERRFYRYKDGVSNAEAFHT